jgi:hypothetical protein
MGYFDSTAQSARVDLGDRFVVWLSIRFEIDRKSAPLKRRVGGSTHPVAKLGKAHSGRHTGCTKSAVTGAFR